MNEHIESGNINMTFKPIGNKSGGHDSAELCCRCERSHDMGHRCEGGKRSAREKLPHLKVIYSSPKNISLSSESIF